MCLLYTPDSLYNSLRLPALLLSPRAIAYHTQTAVSLLSMCCAPRPSLSLPLYIPYCLPNSACLLPLIPNSAVRCCYLSILCLFLRIPCRSTIVLRPDSLVWLSVFSICPIYRFRHCHPPPSRLFQAGCSGNSLLDLSALLSGFLRHNKSSLSRTRLGFRPYHTPALPLGIYIRLSSARALLFATPSRPHYASCLRPPPSPRASTNLCYLPVSSLPLFLYHTRPRSFRLSRLNNTRSQRCFFHNTDHLSDSLSPLLDPLYRKRMFLSNIPQTNFPLYLSLSPLSDMSSGLSIRSVPSSSNCFAIYYSPDYSHSPNTTNPSCPTILLFAHLPCPICPRPPFRISPAHNLLHSPSDLLSLLKDCCRPL